MKPTLFEEITRGDILVRLARLEPDAPARWGTMSGLEMLAHQAEILRYALGEVSAQPRGGPMSHKPLNWLVIHHMPWPKGKAPSPPEFLVPAAENWNEAVAYLDRLVKRFGERGPGADWPVSPAFGRITGKSWGVLGWRHVDHHLTQFGA